MEKEGTKFASIHGHDPWMPELLCSGANTGGGPDNDINSADIGEHAVQVKVDNNKFTIRCFGGNGSLVSNILQQIDVSGSKSTIISQRQSIEHLVCMFAQKRQKQRSG